MRPVTIGPRIELDLAGRDGGGQPGQGPAAIGASAGPRGRRRPAHRRSKQVGEAIERLRQGAAERADEATATVRAPATETCWPITALTASSWPATAPGTAAPASCGPGAEGRGPARGARRRRPGRRRGRAAVGHWRRPAGGPARRAAGRLRSTWGPTSVRCIVPGHEAGQGAAVGAADDLLDAGHRAGAEARADRRRRTAGAAQQAAAGLPTNGASLRAGGARSAWIEHRARTVSLNWRRPRTRTRRPPRRRGGRWSR